jgi:hypothetical protein
VGNTDARGDDDPFGPITGALDDGAEVLLGAVDEDAAPDDAAPDDAADAEPAVFFGAELPLHALSVDPSTAATSTAATLRHFIESSASPP